MAHEMCPKACASFALHDDPTNQNCFAINTSPPFRVTIESGTFSRGDYTRVSRRRPTPRGARGSRTTVPPKTQEGLPKGELCPGLRGVCALNFGQVCAQTVEASRCPRLAPGRLGRWCAERWSMVRLSQRGKLCPESRWQVVTQASEGVLGAKTFRSEVVSSLLFSSVTCSINRVEVWVEYLWWASVGHTCRTIFRMSLSSCLVLVQTSQHFPTFSP